MSRPTKLTKQYSHPANFGFCDLTGCEVISPPEWNVIEPNFACGVGYIKNRVIFSLPWGRGSETGMLKYVEILQNIFENHLDHGEKVIIIDDFSQYSGVSQKARKIYITSLKECPHIAGLVCYNLSKYFRFNLGIGRRLHLVPYPIEFRDNYEQSIKCASKILKKPIGNIDASLQLDSLDTQSLTGNEFPLIRDVSADTMHAEYRRVSEDTILVNCKGEFTKKGIDGVFSQRHKHITNSDKPQMKYLIVNQGKQELSLDLIAYYAKIISQNPSDKSIKLGVLIGEHVFANTTERYLNMLVPFSVVEAHDIEEAITIINCHKNNSATPINLDLPEPENIKTKADLTDTLIYILSNTRWQIPGIFKIAEKYPPEHELRVLLDALDTIKTDVDITMREQQSRMTELAKASGVIKSSEERYRALFDFASDGILVVDEKGIITDCNTAATTLFDTTRDELVNQQAFSFVPFIEVFIKKDSPKENNNVTDIKTTAIRKQDEKFPISISLRRIKIKSKTHVIVYIHDNSENIEVQQAILDTASRITRRIGSDLHDSLGQKLVGASYLVQAILKNFDNQKPALRPKLETLLDVVQSSISETRALSHGLNPAEHTGGGFLVGLARFIEKSHEMYMLECDVHITLCEEDIPPDTGNHLYYILQESINNAIKHGKATRVKLTLDKIDQATGRMIVEDNGAGLKNGEAFSSSGIGLKLMRYRMDMINGTFASESPPGKGLKLTYTFPISTS